MRILIDGMNLALTQGTGVATYARNLSYCIKQNGHDLTVLYGRNTAPFKNKILRESVFFDTYEKGRKTPEYLYDVARSIRPLRPFEIFETGQVLRNEVADRLPMADTFLNIRHLFFKGTAKFQWLKDGIEVILDEPVDIAHWTYPVPVRIRGAKNIYTIHDMVPIKLPYTTLDRKSVHFRTLKWVVEHADQIITVSDCSKQDIVDILDVPAEKVTNTYQSVRIDPKYMDEPLEDCIKTIESINVSKGLKAKKKVTEDADASASEAQGLKNRGYFLFVGAIEPKKNLRRVLEAHAASRVDYPLVVVGKTGWSFEREVEFIKNSDNIIHLNYLPMNQLIPLMRCARAMVFPSLYEGFGLPILEAFLCGTPVITSDASSTKEIAGDAALLIDPYEVSDIRDAFKTLSARGSEKQLEEMRQKGLKRAERFDQDVIAAELETCYREIMAK